MTKEDHNSCNIDALNNIIDTFTKKIELLEKENECLRKNIYMNVNENDYKLVFITIATISAAFLFTSIIFKYIIKM